MLFNSYEFIFVFLPLTLACYFLLGRRSRGGALRWIILASLGFYAWWRPVNVLIIAPSILINFALARMLQRLVRDGHASRARAVLIVGLIFNVAFLGYFKYANFATDVVNDVTGTNFVLARIILPLGLSFITFQKIAFLIDVHARRVEEFSLQDYCLFVLFFPQLIAGPIVHYREMMPQFQKLSGRPEPMDFAVGLTLFAFGLFKKVVLADRIAPMVSEIFGHAATGAPTTLLTSWLAAIGFTFQIYFDFAGYSDMALGLARLFGVRFPPNFDSPLKASNIVDFWLRWHMTLTRFLTGYLYNPLALALTRRRLAAGHAGLLGGRTSVWAFMQLLVFPTLLTMLVSGFWHGAGYLFLLWGLLHGVYLSINHAWRMFGVRQFRDKARYLRIMKPIGFALTFGCVVVSMVIFRSDNLLSAHSMLIGMTGLSGIALPDAIHSRLGPLAGIMDKLGVTGKLEVDVDLRLMVVKVGLLGFIALLCPNTLRLMARYEPALGIGPEPTERLLRSGRFAWRPSLAWALVACAVMALGVMRLGGRSEFLYWQF